MDLAAARCLRSTNPIHAQLRILDLNSQVWKNLVIPIILLRNSYATDRERTLCCDFDA